MTNKNNYNFIMLISDLTRFEAMENFRLQRMTFENISRGNNIYTRTKYAILMVTLINNYFTYRVSFK
jgi:hypothetical protein